MKGKEIKEIVDTFYGVNTGLKTRREEVALPRQIGMYLCRRYTKLSYLQIARIFYRKDHTTAIHAERKITEMLRDKHFKKEVHEVRHKFLNRVNKFNAKKREIDGFKFDSIAESKYYLALRERLKNMEIGELQIHPWFHITINGKKIGKVILDFSYYDKKLEKVIYVDVKGFDTTISRWKRKCVEAQFGIKVEVIKC